MTAKIELIKDGRPVVIEQADNGVITIQAALSDVDESGRTQAVLIHLTEHVEVIVPRISDPDLILSGANEHAVARVELLDGDVQALLWDHAAVEHDTEPQVFRLTPADAA